MVNLNANFQTREQKKKRKLKKWVKVTIASFVILFGVYKLGTMLLNELIGIGSGVVVTEEGETLDNARKYREEGKDVTINWNEEQALATMHKMTHQKVRASVKWGAVEMTPERIDELIRIVKDSDYEHKDEMLKILKKWKKGDFSKIDKDHNTIWEWQGGTIGRATGILSPEEEKEFIEETFRDQ